MKVKVEIRAKGTQDFSWTKKLGIFIGVLVINDLPHLMR
jgi:hypothetical protein